ncbi:TPA: hypothetical protein I4G69_003823 [Enterobacter asburiae]|nr:hypothetical protein [Enterobacter asburiae]
MDIRNFLADKEAINRVSSLFSEIKKEFAGSSDRGIAIIAASMLDNLLQQLLSDFLIDINKKETKNLIFSNNGPLANFSNKILMSHGLGLISDFDRDLLNNIRGVRNKFAHEISEISFNHDSIKGKCKNLIIPDDLVVSMDIETMIDNEFVIYKPVKTDYREVFQMAAYTAMTILAARRTQIFFAKCEPLQDLKHREDFMLIQIAAEETLQRMVLNTIEEGKAVDSTISEEGIHRLYNLNEKLTKKLSILEEQRLNAVNAKVIEKADIFRTI